MVCARRAERTALSGPVQVDPTLKPTICVVCVMVARMIHCGLSASARAVIGEPIIVQINLSSIMGLNTSLKGRRGEGSRIKRRERIKGPELTGGAESTGGAEKIQGVEETGENKRCGR